MLSVLELLPILLAPVAALLFLDLFRSRRLRYPHDLLEAAERRGAASLLFRSLRRRYDVVLDAMIAIALAFALPASRPAAPGAESRGGRAAVVVDCSRSMLAGPRGSRPLDLATKRMAEDPALRKAEAFALAFDPEGMRTRLFPVQRVAKEAERERRAAAAAAGAGAEGPARAAGAAERAADALEARLPFFAVDYGALAELRHRGYGSITLLSDSLGFRAEGFSAVESGFAVAFAAYPTAARYDRASESWLVALAEAGPRGAISVFALDERSGRPSPLDPKRYAIEEGGSGRSVRFAQSGLYVVSIKDPAGGPNVEIPLRFLPPHLPIAAYGPFSERMASVFPLLERSRSPLLALSDLGEKRPRPAAPAGVVTALVPGNGSLVLDPALSGGRPIAAAMVRGADFALGPSSLANEDLPLAYDSAIAALAPATFVIAPPAGARALVPVGSAFLARTEDGLVPLMAPASEFFETRTAGVVSLPPPSPRRLGWALLLAALAAAKLVLRRLLRKRGAA